MSAVSLVPSETIEAEHWPAYVLDRTGTIVQVNKAWDREAHAAGGPMSSAVLGTGWLDWISGDEPRSWHAALLASLLGRRSRPREGDVVQRCECNTPTRFRLFATRFAPLVTFDASEPAGVLVLTTLLAEGPVETQHLVGPPDPARYLQPQGLILMCSGCRRALVAGTEPRRWEIVPSFIVSPPAKVSHGICNLCRRLYYGLPPRGQVRA